MFWPTPAASKTPRQDDSLVNTNKQWFQPMVCKWCDMDLVHPPIFFLATRRVLSEEEAPARGPGGGGAGAEVCGAPAARAGLHPGGGASAKAPFSARAKAPEKRRGQLVVGREPDSELASKFVLVLE